MDNGRADLGQPSAPSDAAPGRWQQRGGFSVFFDAQTTGPGGSGELRRRTRLYHEETGNETTLRGWEPADWVRWMLDRLGSARPASGPAGAAACLVSVEVVDVRLAGDAAAREGDDAVADTAAVELRLRVTGLAELRRTLGAKVAGVLFGPYPR